MQVEHVDGWDRAVRETQVRPEADDPAVLGRLRDPVLVGVDQVLPGADGERSVLEVQVLHARRRPGVGVRSRGGAGRPAECGDRQPRAEHEDDHQRHAQTPRPGGRIRPTVPRASAAVPSPRTPTVQRGRQSAQMPRHVRRAGARRRPHRPRRVAGRRGGLGAGGVGALGARARAGRRAARLHAPRRHGGLRVRDLHVHGCAHRGGARPRPRRPRPPVASTSASTRRCRLSSVWCVRRGVGVHAATAP